MNNIKQFKCWCGNTDLLPFSPEYFKCDNCETLISKNGLSSEELTVSDDDSDFYGRKYWETHQTQDLDQPDVFTRSRTDLTERSLHWLRTVFKYKLPPAKILELGSAHGGFVALLNRVGYDAEGLELSPFIVDFARSTFGVPMYCGPVESQGIADSSLDVIALMDVIEHLPDPESTMKHCMRLLKPDGIMIIQCPQYIEGKTYQSILDEKDPFVIQLKSDEHLNLFSKTSIYMLFDKLGAKSIEFENAIFSMYDMFLVVGKEGLNVNSIASIDKHLQSTIEGRFIQAMLDMYEVNEACNKDRSDRFKIIEVLCKYLVDSSMEVSKAERVEFVKNITGLMYEQYSHIDW